MIRRECGFLIDLFLNNLVEFFEPGIRVEKSEELTSIYIRDKTFSILTEELEVIVSEVEAIEKINENILFNGYSYEVLIDTGGPISREDIVVLDDEKNNVEYTIGSPSVEFSIYFINHLAPGLGEFRRRFRTGPTSPMISRGLEEVDNFIDVLKLLLRRLETIKIESKSRKNLETFKTLADSVTFEIAYNTGFSIKQIKNIQEYSVPRRVNRRNKLEDCEAPKRKYNPDLIYHYQMGLSTHHPALKFISFYHVMEHFFNIVYTEKMIENVKVLITKPSFSAKRDTDIDKLIKEIRNNFKIESELNSAKNEIEALKLVLNNYLDLDILINGIKEYDDELYNYYSTKKVEFSQGAIINFNDDKGVYGNLANRIYKTRNAVIHSKAYEKERYIPFEHENELLKEIPLIQFIAEDIILKTSEIL